MCGIVGVASIAAQPTRTWLVDGRDFLFHRGPDDFGEWWSDDGRVGLAHRRLSIIDPTLAGHQPMLDTTGACCIIFNGEIYNFNDLRSELIAKGYSFRSRTDTEVILAAYCEWGANCLSRLNGMFSFALYDIKQQTIFLARDRAGEKPLFYHFSDGTLRFASELKALFADPAMQRKVDPAALDCYLAMGYVPGSRCIVKGYNKLPSAHALQFDLRTGKTKLWRYWELPKPNYAKSMGPEEVCALLNELEETLESAVRNQLVADVPVGILLSGGVDSSLITAMAVRASSQIQTFSVGFPGYGNVDETEHARLIARHFGTHHREIVAALPTVDMPLRLARQFDEPIADSSMIPTFLVSQLVRQHCKVALGGDGADEMFGGYDHYSRMLLMRAVLRWIPRNLRSGIALVSQYVLPLGFKGRNWLKSFGFDMDHGLPMIGSFFDASTRRNLSSVEFGNVKIAGSSGWVMVPEDADLLQRATRMDFQTYLAEDILVKLDRASMLASLEVRAPFLDCRLLDFAFARVPSNLKANIWDKKILLKQLAARVLPPRFDLRRKKQGFSIPLAEWLKGGAFRTMFNDVLLDRQCCFDSKIVKGLLRGQDQGYNNGERLYALLMFELWRKEYGVAL